MTGNDDGRDRDEGLATVSYLPWARPSATDQTSSTEQPSSTERPRATGAAHDGGAAARERVRFDDEGDRDESGSAAPSPAPTRRRPVSLRGRTDEVGGEPLSGGRGARAMRGAGSSRDDASSSGGGASSEAARERREARAADRAARRAENVSLAALTRRGQSRAELEALLTSRELEPEAVDAELARLESVGLIDDDALAADLIDRLRNRKGLGRTALASELRRRKLDAETVERALATMDGDDEAIVAEQVAVDRVSRLRGLDRQTAERRLASYLMRKGYSGEIVRNAVRTALDDVAFRSHGSVRFE